MKQPKAFRSVEQKLSKQTTSGDNHDHEQYYGTYVSHELNFIPLEVNDGKLLFFLVWILTSSFYLLIFTAPDFIALWTFVCLHLFFLSLQWSLSACIVNMVYQLLFICYPLRFHYNVSQLEYIIISNNCEHIMSPCPQQLRWIFIY